VRFELDNIVETLQDGGYEVALCRSTSAELLELHTSELRGFDAVAAAGGDGGISRVVNALVKNGVDIPVGIIRAGTANDLATFLKLPLDSVGCAEVISAGKTAEIDLGLVKNGNGEQYFVNVFGAGFLANISQNIDDNFKDMFGKFAYYISGLGALPRYVPLRLRIGVDYPDISQREYIEDEFALFLVFNGAGAGGFANLAPGAALDDGKLDLVAFRNIPIWDMALLMTKVLSGDYFDDENVVYRRSERITAEFYDELPQNPETDADGERGLDLPVEITCLHKKLTIFVP